MVSFYNIKQDSDTHTKGYSGYKMYIQNKKLLHVAGVIILTVSSVHSVAADVNTVT